MGLGEMRRGRVDTLYSEQESIRFVVKKSCFVPFLQWVAISLSASAGSPGRSGELRSSTDCAACQLTPSRTRLPRSPGRPGFHKFPDHKSAGPVFAGSFHPEISPRGHAPGELLPRPCSCPRIFPSPSHGPSHWTNADTSPALAPGRTPPDGPHADRVPTAVRPIHNRGVPPGWSPFDRLARMPGQWSPRGRFRATLWLR